MRNAVLIAACCHVVLAFAVSFNSDSSPRYNRQIEVTLATRPSQTAPDEAQHIAQQNEQGNGGQGELAKDVENGLHPQLCGQQAIAGRGGAALLQVARHTDPGVEGRLALGGEDAGQGVGIEGRRNPIGHYHEAQVSPGLEGVPGNPQAEKAAPQQLQRHPVLVGLVAERRQAFVREQCAIAVRDVAGGKVLPKKNLPRHAVQSIVPIWTN